MTEAMSFLQKAILLSYDPRPIVKEFESKVLLACEHPEMHPLSQMPEVAARGYRVMPVMRYVVLYAYRDDRLVIAHIFHSLQDYARYV